MKLTLSGILLIFCNTLFAQAPVVENVRFEQRTDGSLLVDIHYDVTDQDGNFLNITIDASDDHGATWTLPCSSLTGDVGTAVMPGTDKHAVWDFYTDNPNTSGDGYRVRVTAHEILNGLNITEDLTLMEDFKCPPDSPYAIKIAAPNVTLDLGGYEISNCIGDYPSFGIMAEHVDGITIMNGTFDGFLIAIDLINTDNATIDNLTIRNLEVEDPDTDVIGINLLGSQDIIAQNILFKFLPVLHKEAIVAYYSDLTVDNIDVYGGAVGVNFSNVNSTSSEDDDRVNGGVLNSRFYDITIAGILVSRTNSMQIYNNIFTNNEIGIATNPPYDDAVSELSIDGNKLHDCISFGIRFTGAIESSITNNNVKNNGGYGISLEPKDLIGSGSGQNFFIATGNFITDNVVTGHQVDLYHHETCIGNTWERNTYATKQGAEIPPPTVDSPTARDSLASIDEIANSVVADAQLLFVASWDCDTTGKSYKWVYIYESASQQQNYEFWVQSGQIIKQDTVTVPWMINENLVPIIGSWIDSDSALVIAEEKGGKAFREANIIEQIELILAKSPELLWNVNYIAGENSFNTSFDASSGTRKNVFLRSNKR